MSSIQNPAFPRASMRGTATPRARSGAGSYPYVSPPGGYPLFAKKSISGAVFTVNATFSHTFRFLLPFLGGRWLPPLAAGTPGDGTAPPATGPLGPPWRLPPFREKVDFLSGFHCKRHVFSHFLRFAVAFLAKKYWAPRKPRKPT